MEKQILTAKEIRIGRKRSCFTPRHLTPYYVKQIIRKAEEAEFNPSLSEILYSAVLMRERVFGKFPDLGEKTKLAEQGQLEQSKFSEMRGWLLAQSPEKFLRSAKVWEMASFENSFPAKYSFLFGIFGIRTYHFRIDWKKKDGIEVGRNRIFDALPQLAQQIRAAEEKLGSGKRVGGREMHALRGDILTTCNEKKMNELGFAYAANKGHYYKSFEDMLNAFFPLLRLGKKIYFAGKYNLCDPEDVVFILDYLKERSDTRSFENVTFWQQSWTRRSTTLPDGTKVSMRSLMKRMAEQIIPQTWFFYQPPPFDVSKLTVAQAFKLVVRYLYNEKQGRRQVFVLWPGAKEQILAEFHDIHTRTRYFNEDILNLNSVYIKEFGYKAIEALFGMSLQAIAVSIQQKRS